MKTNRKELAYYGGTPAFDSPLHVGRPNVGNRERLMALIEDALDRRWLTNSGPYVQQFETELAAFLGVKHCIVACNATVALEIVIRALGMSGEVIVPSFTFVATAHALQWQEITPVFCDIDPRTHNLDPGRIEQMITPKTTGIIGVHVWGRPCAVDSLQRVAQKYDLRLMFDAAHAFGCSYKGQKIGGFGDAEVFSFHATKFFNSFEGGAIATNNDDLAHTIRLMTNFGFAGHDTVIHVGTNGKMNEISAAMGLASLEIVNDFVDVNRRNYGAYRDGLAGIPGIELIAYDEGEANNFQYVVVEVDKAIAGVDRDQLVQILHAENVLARRYFYPGCHQMEPYSSYFPNAGLLLPVTEELTSRVMTLPTGTAVDVQSIATICRIIRLVVGNTDSSLLEACPQEVQVL